MPEKCCKSKLKLCLLLNGVLGQNLLTVLYFLTPSIYPRDTLKLLPQFVHLCGRSSCCKAHKLYPVGSLYRNLARFARSPLQGWVTFLFFHIDPLFWPTGTPWIFLNLHITLLHPGFHVVVEVTAWNLPYCMWGKSEKRQYAVRKWFLTRYPPSVIWFPSWWLITYILSLHITAPYKTFFMTYVHFCQFSS